ncbi:hypothetical protein I3900191A7_14400 [Clostridium baratii]|uniref:hypothetical protein n=1 Tax=Clostridium baratii TaxID=1561 RepID=UPI0036F1A061
MKVEEGKIIKVIKTDYHGKSCKKIGKVEKLYKNYILLDLKDYKICLGMADIVDPKEYKLKIKKKKEWIDVTKEMLEVGVVS